MELIFIGPIWITLAIASAWIASSRGYSGLLWLIFGMVFGIFAVIFAVTLKDRSYD